MANTIDTINTNCRYFLMTVSVLTKYTFSAFYKWHPLGSILSSETYLPTKETTVFQFPDFQHQNRKFSQPTDLLLSEEYTGNLTA